MSNSVKLKNDNFLDSINIVHNKETLDVILGRMAGIGGACKIISGDLNTACGNATGFYMGPNLTNCPSGVTVGYWWFIIHIVHDKNIAKQIALSLAKRRL